MSNKKIKTLIESSYKNNELDLEKVSKIADYLTKQDLKHYIRELKNEEYKRRLIITLPFTQGEGKLFEKLFPNRTIIYKKDPSLMVGVKILDNDILYEFNLKNTFSNIISYIEQNYD